MASTETMRKCLAILNAAYGSSRAPAPPVEVLAVWTMVLSDMPDDALLSATKAHIAHPERGQFWPTPADLLRDTPPKQTQRQLDKAAWAGVISRLSGGCHTASGYLDQVQMRALQAIGGMYSLRMADTSALPGLKRQWLDAVDALRAKSSMAMAAPVAARQLGGA